MSSIMIISLNFRRSSYVETCYIQGTVQVPGTMIEGVYPMLDPTLQKKKRFEKIRKGLMYNNEEDSSPKPPNLCKQQASKATKKEMRHQARNLEFPEHPIPCCVLLSIAGSYGTCTNPTCI